jgi:hypothetical protein
VGNSWVEREGAMGWATLAHACPLIAQQGCHKATRSRMSDQTKNKCASYLDIAIGVGGRGLVSWHLICLFSLLHSQTQTDSLRHGGDRSSPRDAHRQGDIAHDIADFATECPKPLKRQHELSQIQTNVTDGLPKDNQLQSMCSQNPHARWWEGENK